MRRPSRSPSCESKASVVHQVLIDGPDFANRKALGVIANGIAGNLAGKLRRLFRILSLNPVEKVAAVRDRVIDLRDVGPQVGRVWV